MLYVDERLKALGAYCSNNARMALTPRKAATASTNHEIVLRSHVNADLLYVKVGSSVTVALLLAARMTKFS